MKNKKAPYMHNLYSSVYEGVQVEIQIVDHCNLNCGGCNHFSPCLKPYNISLIEYEKNLIKITNNIPNVKLFAIVGGEPTLHPNLDKICELTRKYFPKSRIVITTNGVKVSYLNQIYNTLIKNDIEIQFTLYPGLSQEQEMSVFLNNYQNSHCTNTRIQMGETLVSENPLDKEHNFFNCTHYNLPCFTVKDEKIFFCPFAAHISKFAEQYNLNIPITAKDFLYLDDIKNNLDILNNFCNEQKDICAYCVHEHTPVPWHKSYKDITEYTSSFLDLYFTNYDRYLEIIMSKELYNNYKKTKIKSICDIYIDSTKLAKRFGEGKIDIIIPYHNISQDIIQQLYDTLIEQTIIEDCVIYLISDNSPDEKQVIQYFSKNSKLNVVFLKNQEHQGPGVARNIGIMHGFNKYIFPLDSDDYFLSNKALEYIYNMNYNLDASKFIMYDQDKKTKKDGFIFKRDLLLQNNILYPPLFFGEDFYFYFILCDFVKIKYIKDSDNLVCWNCKNDQSLTHCTQFKNSVEKELNLIISHVLALYYRVFLMGDKNGYYNYYKTFFDVYNRYIYLKQEKDNIEFKLPIVILYFSLYNLYTLYPQIFIDCKVIQDFLVEIQNNFSFHSEYIQLIKDNKYISNTYTKQLFYILEQLLFLNQEEV